MCACMRSRHGHARTRRYIAGVTNPVFREKHAWWDVLCDAVAGTVVDSTLGVEAAAAGGPSAASAAAAAAKAGHTGPPPAAAAGGGGDGGAVESSSGGGGVGGGAGGGDSDTEHAHALADAAPSSAAAAAAAGGGDASANSDTDAAAPGSVGGPAASAHGIGAAVSHAAAAVTSLPGLRGFHLSGALTQGEQDRRFLREVRGTWARAPTRRELGALPAASDVLILLFLVELADGGACVPPGGCGCEAVWGGLGPRRV